MDPTLDFSIFSGFFCIFEIWNPPERDEIHNDSSFPHGLVQYPDAKPWELGICTYHFFSINLWQNVGNYSSPMVSHLGYSLKVSTTSVDKPSSRKHQPTPGEVWSWPLTTFPWNSSNWWTWRWYLWLFFLQITSDGWETERLKNLILPTRGWFGLVIFSGMKYLPSFVVILIPSRGRVRPYPTNGGKVGKIIDWFQCRLVRDRSQEV